MGTGSESSAPRGHGWGGALICLYVSPHQKNIRTHHDASFLWGTVSTHAFLENSFLIRVGALQQEARIRHRQLSLIVRLLLELLFFNVVASSKSHYK